MTAADPKRDGRGANQNAHSCPELPCGCKHADHGGSEEIHGQEPRITEQDTEITCEDHVQDGTGQSAAFVPEAPEITGDEQG
ncbi:hypothetical protein D3C87_1901730 [compost metagenome]